ncbi:hypothetical protein [Amycolatopsis thermoflava]|uniref:Uncharacterized protein n=1 Tax=Amycolatopsis thermoflava TaxID=84480 RepID=A0A3N2GQ53_9PSEU|nr:hypothetical protein [Amycolatopsis thermoflava]ROS38768.1 hypothetical protein EDD35_1056 [Amycolatopsis thermoflava]
MRFCWRLCEEGGSTVWLRWREPVVIARLAGLVSSQAGPRQAGAPRRMGERS